jgi:hypothetical protein
VLARLAVVAGVIAISSCSRPDAPKVKTAPPSPAEWRVECRPVKDDRHQACFGPGWDANTPREPGKYHFYQVSVERTQASEAPTVLFVKRFAAADVDAKLLQEGYRGEVARYDARSRSVRFAVAAEPIVVPLAEAVKAKR